MHCLPRYEVARNFRPPGRLMFLRPVKEGPRTKVAQRTYDAVWITSEARPVTGLCHFSLFWHDPAWAYKLLSWK